MRALAVNGSPRMGRGLTDLVLGSFLDGMREAGADAERLYAQRIRLEPCACGEMHCWTTTPGACCIDDGMDEVVPKLKAADTLVLATPVYIALPERMQSFVNRLCPLVEPRLTFVGGRTRGRLRDGYALRRFVAVVTGGWWEPENAVLDAAWRAPCVGSRESCLGRDRRRRGPRYLDGMLRQGAHEGYDVSYDTGGRAMPASRITVTIPGDLVARIDRVERNRSRFIAEAVERELHRRLREELRRSLDAPHSESLEVAEEGLAAYRDALPAEPTDLVDAAEGVRVAWRDGEGWSRVGER
jgi:multimeric flavodoxin WrbA